MLEIRTINNEKMLVTTERMIGLLFEGKEVYKYEYSMLTPFILLDSNRKGFRDWSEEFLCDDYTYIIAIPLKICCEVALWQHGDEMICTDDNGNFSSDVDSSTLIWWSYRLIAMTKAKINLIKEIVNSLKEENIIKEKDFFIKKFVNNLKKEIVSKGNKDTIKEIVNTFKKEIELKENHFLIKEIMYTLKKEIDFENTQIMEEIKEKLHD